MVLPLTNNCAAKYDGKELTRIWSLVPPQIMWCISPGLLHFCQQNWTENGHFYREELTQGCSIFRLWDCNISAQGWIYMPVPNLPLCPLSLNVAETSASFETLSNIQRKLQQSMPIGIWKNYKHFQWAIFFTLCLLKFTTAHSHIQIFWLSHNQLTGVACDVST